MIEPRVLPLHECICEIASKNRLQIIENLCDLYSTPFGMDHVENVFEFPETFLGETDKGEVAWEGWRCFDGLYTMVDEEMVYPTPATIGDFIDDCRRIWGIDLVWEGNLMKRGFRYDFNTED